MTGLSKTLPAPAVCMQRAAAHSSNVSNPEDIDMGHAGWWTKPDFVINELNVQSVVTAPGHDEMIPMQAAGHYTVKGFAYSGAGPCCNLLHYVTLCHMAVTHQKVIQCMRCWVLHVLTWQESGLLIALCDLRCSRQVTPMLERCHQ